MIIWQYTSIYILQWQFYDQKKKIDTKFILFYFKSHKIEYFNFDDSEFYKLEILWTYNYIILKILKIDHSTNWKKPTNLKVHFKL